MSKTMKVKDRNGISIYEQNGKKISKTLTAPFINSNGMCSSISKERRLKAQNTMNRIIQDENGNCHTIQEKRNIKYKETINRLFELPNGEKTTIAKERGRAISKTLNAESNGTTIAKEKGKKHSVTLNKPFINPKTGELTNIAKETGKKVKETNSREFFLEGGVSSTIYKQNGLKNSKSVMAVKLVDGVQTTIAKERGREMAATRKKNGQYKKGDSNPLSKSVYLYNEEGILVDSFISTTSFKEYCIEWGLPFVPLYKTLALKVGLYNKKSGYTRAIKLGLEQYRGWYITR